MLLNVVNTIWFWAFWFKEDWTPQSDLIERQRLNLCRKALLQLNGLVWGSIADKLFYRRSTSLFVCALKWTWTTIKYGFLMATVSRIILKLLAKDWILSLDWLEDLYKEIKLDILSSNFILKLIHSWKKSDNYVQIDYWGSEDILKIYDKNCTVHFFFFLISPLRLVIKVCTHTNWRNITTKKI